jgi:protein-disulfide isomerase
MAKRSFILQFWGLLGIFVVLFAAIIIISGRKTSAPIQNAATSNLSQHLQGQGKSGVTLVEYGDYQCPYCKQFYPIVKQVVAENKDQIYFQFRNFPLSNAHPHAFAAAQAAEAADKQGKFWQMHDLLYENQDQWATADTPAVYFGQYAKQLGLHAAQFNHDYTSQSVINVIKADAAEAQRLKLPSTPSFLINGKEVQVQISVESLRQLVQAAIAQRSVSAAN